MPLNGHRAWREPGYSVKRDVCLNTLPGRLHAKGEQIHDGIFAFDTLELGLRMLKQLLFVGITYNEEC